MPDLVPKGRPEAWCPKCGKVREIKGKCPCGNDLISKKVLVKMRHYFQEELTNTNNALKKKLAATERRAEQADAVIRMYAEECEDPGPKPHICPWCLKTSEGMSAERAVHVLRKKQGQKQ